MITTIDGWAGAGKTTLAEYLAQVFGDRGSTFILHLDDLYGGWEDPLGRELTEKLLQIVETYQTGGVTQTRKYDWTLEKFDQPLDIPQVDHLIIEGVGAGQRSIRNFVDTKIWVEVEPVVGLRRVLERDASCVPNQAIFESQMRSFQEKAALHFAEEGTMLASDFEVNGHSRV